MAQIVDPSAAYMPLPKGILRGNPVPVDKTLVWADESAMKAYASSDGTAYVGQILALVKDNVATPYIIKDKAGTVEPLPYASDVSGKISTSSIVTSMNASSTNTTVPGALATYTLVNNSIQSLASYYLTKDAAGNSFATKAELNSAISSGKFYNGGVLVTPKNNDYTIVQADESHSSGQKPTTRYNYDGKQWAFQYIVNNTTFTTEQLAAINSGITSSTLGTITSNVSTLSGKFPTAAYPIVGTNSTGNIVSALDYTTIKFAGKSSVAAGETKTHMKIADLAAPTNGTSQMVMITGAAGAWRAGKYMHVQALISDNNSSSFDGSAIVRATSGTVATNMASFDIVVYKNSNGTGAVYLVRKVSSTAATYHAWNFDVSYRSDASNGGYPGSQTWTTAPTGGSTVWQLSTSNTELATKGDLSSYATTSLLSTLSSALSALSSLVADKLDSWFEKETT